MPDFSLVPVDHQPDFSDVSLIPVDHDPFGADGAVQQGQAQLAQTQPAQPQPENPPPPAASQPNVGGPSDQSKPTLADGSSPSTPGDCYPSADAAAVAALQNINPTSQRYGLEYAGRVYHRWLGLGDYSYTPPLEGNAYSSDPGNRVLTPLFHSLGVNAGAYHTHTRGNDPVLNENYSLKDKRDSDDEGAPAYLGAPSGIIYKYSPAPNQPSQGQISVLGNTRGSTDKSIAQP
jgi:Domain of unknown function (DUF4329)